MIRRLLLGLIFLALSALPALAQQDGCPNSGVNCVAVQGFSPSGIAALAVTSSTGRVALGSSGASLSALVANAGAATAYVALGGSGVTAATTDIPIASGQSVAFALGSSTYIAGITASGTAALTITTGRGWPNTTAGGGGGLTMTLPAKAAFTTAGCTVGVSSGTCLAANLVTTHLQVQNTSTGSTNFIACNFGGTAVLNASGSFMLAPQQTANWGGSTGVVPTGALNCISTAGSAPLYVEYN